MVPQFNTLEEAKQFFLDNPNGGTCVLSKSVELTATTMAEAEMFFAAQPAASTDAAADQNADEQKTA